MKSLVAIANYGPYRYGYLDKLIRACQAWPARTDLVVLSDRPKRLPPGVHLAVGLPTDDPCSLPFAARPLFADHRDEYDLFVYTEDDIHITPANVQAFLNINAALHDDEVAGLVRYERDDTGRRWIVDAHPPYDWVPGSVVRRGDFTLARFGNVHSACFLLTRPQLLRCLDSGGFLVDPHDTYNDTRASAATDPYTRCGLTRLVCLSHIETILTHHMADNYIGLLGTDEATYLARCDALQTAAPPG